MGCVLPFRRSGSNKQLKLLELQEDVLRVSSLFVQSVLSFHIDYSIRFIFWHVSLSISMYCERFNQMVEPKEFLVVQGCVFLLFL